MATPTVREVVSASASGTSATVNTGAGTAIGDILVCFYGSNYYTLAGMGSPSGTAGTWNLETTGDQGALEAHVKCFTRTVTASGAQTVTVPANIDAEVFQITYVIASANAVDGAAGSQGASSTSHIAPSVSPTGADDLLLCTCQSGPSSVASYTPPGSMTNGISENAAGGGGIGSARQILASSGATGSRTFTCSVSQSFATASIALSGGSAPKSLIPNLARRYRHLLTR